MHDWALAYVRHVMAEKGWTGADLAKRIGMAPSTINRPLNDPDHKSMLSRKTIGQIAQVSGIDPAPFAPGGLAEATASYLPYVSSAARALAGLDAPLADGVQKVDVKIGIHGRFAQIIATIDKAALAELRAKLDYLEQLMSD